MTYKLNANSKNFQKDLIKKIILAKKKILLKVNIKIWMKNNAC